MISIKHKKQIDLKAMCLLEGWGCSFKDVDNDQIISHVLCVRMCVMKVRVPEDYVFVCDMK